MTLHCRPLIYLFALLPLLPGAAGAAPGPAPAFKRDQAVEAKAIATAATAQAAVSGAVLLTPRLLLQLVAARSAEVGFSKAQIDVAAQLSKGEAALYETVFFADAQRAGTLRQRTIEERLSSVATSNLAVLDETIKTAEVGVREKLPSGADMTLSYRGRSQRNNIIASASTSDTQHDGSMILQVKQPLLRGFGKAVTETDMRVARVEYQIAVQQYRQQLLKSGSDALALYWQLYRAREVQRIRQQALDYGHQVENDTLARIDAGKLAKSNSIESHAAVLVREVELIRARQGVREAETRLATILNVASLSSPGLSLQVAPDASSPAPDGSAGQRYQAALLRWPPLAIARLRAEQAGVRLDFAKNQSLPALDLVLSRTRTGLATKYGDARELVQADTYPSWSIGLNLEIPLGGNGKARAQANAQSARVRQAEIEIESIQSALANDVENRWAQVVGGQEEMTRMESDVSLRTELLRIEQVRYDAGLGTLYQLLQREAELSESRQRLVDSNSRMGAANDALLFADGSLLEHYDITVKE